MQKHLHSVAEIIVVVSEREVKSDLIPFCFILFVLLEEFRLNQWNIASFYFLLRSRESKDVNRKKKKDFLRQSNHQRWCFGRKQQMREGESLDKSSEKENLQTKCLTSLWQNTGQIQEHLQRHPSVPRQSAVVPYPPTSSRLLTHRLPGLTLSYTKITFLHLKNHRSHASVTHLSRHVSVLLNRGILCVAVPISLFFVNK